MHQGEGGGGGDCTGLTGVGLFAHLTTTRASECSLMEGPADEDTGGG